MGKPDITGERLLQLATFEWQPVEQLRLQLMETVPPGKALRTYQNRTTGNKGLKPLSPDDQITSGARQVANDRIAALVTSGKLEYNEDRTQIRFVERRVVDRSGCCPTCRRPFPEATEEKMPPRPSPRPKVVYPHFPAWQAEAVRKGVS